MLEEEQIKSDLYFSFTPQKLINMGKTVTIPIDDQAALELAKRLNNHFRSWVGCDIKNYL